MIIITTTTIIIIINIVIIIIIIIIISIINLLSLYNHKAKLLFTEKRYNTGNFRKI